jgi:hypothetical protein
MCAFVFLKSWNRLGRSEQYAAFGWMHALATRRCHTPRPPRSSAIVGKIHPSRGTRRKKKKKEMSAEREKKNGRRAADDRAHDAWVVHDTTRHLGPLAAHWPHPRCCLDEVSFPAGAKKEGTTGQREMVERGRESQRETSRASGFCGVSWPRAPFSRKFVNYVSEFMSHDHICGCTLTIYKASSCI